jgi:signal transduction histidine kinase
VTDPRPRSAAEETLATLRADYAELLARLNANQQQFRRLARSVYRVQEDERRRLARELHDGIGQNLTAMKHQLALLRSALPAQPQEADRRAEIVASLCAQTLDETRGLSRLLRPQVLDTLGLEAALRWLLRTLGEAGGLQSTLSIGRLPEPDAELDTLLFRIVQEGLTNVVKHAQASRVEVSLDQRRGWVRLTVSDDGQGPPSARAQAVLAGSGLHGMRERVGLHGGTLALKNQPEGGSMLLVRVPVHDPTAASNP